MQSQSIEKSKRHYDNQVLAHSNLASYENTESKEKILAVIGYITLVGWLVAMVVHGSDKSTFIRFHLRQSLGLIITGALLLLIPLIGWALNIIVIAVWFYVVYHAAYGHQIKVPLLGDCYQEHLDFIK